MHHFPQQSTKHKVNNMNQIAKHNDHKMMNVAVLGQL